MVDNYRLLRGMESETVDLITTDPPFAKNGTFVGKLKPPLSRAELDKERTMLAEWGVRSKADAERVGVEWPTGTETSEFKDIWSWETDVHEEWIDGLLDTHPAVSFLIDNTRSTHSDGHAAYLAWMAVRLIEMHRVLKPTGSLYLHCDHTANSYLRVLLDAIFGAKNFRNEVIWSYRRWTASKKRLPRLHDVMLCYAVSDQPTFHPVLVPNNNPNSSQYVSTKDADGKTVVQRDAYGIPIKRKTSTHLTVGDVWEMPIISPNGKERVGYPTQKPWALAERIIKASSNPGDVVFDPFAGCAYTAVAAERLDRQWIACDISPRSVTVLRRQFAKNGWAIEGEIPDGLPFDYETEMAFKNVTVVGPDGVPERSTVEADKAPPVKPLPERKYKKRATADMSRGEMLELLVGVSGWACWGCGFAVRSPDGSVVRTGAHFHLDHIEAQSSSGSNYIHNRAVLCAPCNADKGRKPIRLKDLRQLPSVQTRREEYGLTESDLCDIDAVQEQAMIEWSAWRAQRGLDTRQEELALG